MSRFIMKRIAIIVEKFMRIQQLVVASMVMAGLVGCTEKDAGENTQQPIAIAIHGGAGTITRENMNPEREEQYRQALAYATEAGYAILEDGGSAADAVQTAIQMMEENKLFNAGRGAVYTYEGRHELDASMMLGETGQAG